MPDDAAEIGAAYERWRPLLFSIAYRMLGSVAEAEDVIQETFLRYQRAVTEASAEVRSPKAYLSAVTTRLAIDHLRSARIRRESYVGEWLPEPLLTGEAGSDPAHHLETAESLSMAFLLLLERLSPMERAVFLLREVFDYRYDEIAAIVGRSAGTCRQLAVRGRRHISDNRPRFEVSRERREALAARFFGAVQTGDMGELVALLAADAVVHGDGGGRGPSWRQPIRGRDTVVRLLDGLGRQMRRHGVTMRPAEVNGQPGVLCLDGGGRLVAVMTVDVVDGAVRTLRSVISPDKLRHLGPLADIPALLRDGERSSGTAADGR